LALRSPAARKTAPRPTDRSGSARDRYGRTTGALGRRGLCKRVLGRVALRPAIGRGAGVRPGAARDLALPRARCARRDGGAWSSRCGPIPVRFFRSPRISTVQLPESTKIFAVAAPRLLGCSCARGALRVSLSSTNRLPDDGHTLPLHQCEPGRRSQSPKC
jgi:hypothetical protein